MLNSDFQIENFPIKNFVVETRIDWKVVLPVSDAKSFSKMTFRILNFNLDEKTSLSHANFATENFIVILLFAVQIGSRMTFHLDDSSFLAKTYEDNWKFIAASIIFNHSSWFDFKVYGCGMLKQRARIIYGRGLQVNNFLQFKKEKGEFLASIFPIMLNDGVRDF
jgi:hypothetical protein